MDPWPITFRGVVGTWEIDMMGHMNVTWYVAKFNHATWTMFDHVGSERRISCWPTTSASPRCRRTFPINASCTPETGSSSGPG